MVDLNNTEIILILSTTITGVVTIINAFFSAFSSYRSDVARAALNRKADSANVKLDTIHESTNGNLTVVQGQLRDALNKIHHLERLLEMQEKTPEIAADPSPSAGI